MENQKIESLTPEQESKIEIYRDKWIKLGLTTLQLTYEQAEADFLVFQKKIMLRNKCSPVVLLNSPSQCWSFIRKQMQATETELTSFIYPYFDGQFWAGWFAFTEFMQKELGVTYDNQSEYDALLACQKYGMVFPLDDVCVVCQPPTVLKTNISGLHCENGPALSYAGDNEIYSLNGVVMPKELVLTRAEEITTEMIFKESNVEIRRELLRKVGIERVMDKIPNRLLDKQGNYELYSLDLSDEVKDARYLKMTNPSIGCFHVEGVSPEISTVADALKWRNQNMFEHADVLT